jgi:hypothetical protein
VAAPGHRDPVMAIGIEHDVVARVVACSLGHIDSSSEYFGANAPACGQADRCQGSTARSVLPSQARVGL